MSKTIESIEDLPGVTENIAQKLRDAGFRSVAQIAAASEREIMEIPGIGETTANKIIEGAREGLDLGFETADKIMERRASIVKLASGSKELDKLVGGGFETQKVTEAYGKYSSGKSQIAFQLAINVQLPKEKGGLEGDCLFIDTENTFSPERVAQIAEATGLDATEALKRIHVARAYNADYQMALLKKAPELIENNNIKLIIVDSLTAKFRTDFIGRATLSDRQQKLGKHVGDLHKLAEAYNLVVYVTNQVMENPGIMFGDPTMPIGGPTLGHATSYRLYLRKSKEDKRIARLVDSPSMPEGEAIFRVTEKGVEDVEEEKKKG
jgi:DNA repair protein RadA